MVSRVQLFQSHTDDTPSEAVWGSASCSKILWHQGCYRLGSNHWAFDVSHKSHSQVELEIYLKVSMVCADLTVLLCAWKCSRTTRYWGASLLRAFTQGGLILSLRVGKEDGGILIMLQHHFYTQHVETSSTDLCDHAFDLMSNELQEVWTLLVFWPEIAGNVTFNFYYLLYRKMTGALNILQNSRWYVSYMRLFFLFIWTSANVYLR